MCQKLLFLALAATLVVLGTAAEAQAYGAAHVGYTHVGPGGVQHYGATAVSGPYGSYGGSHASASSASGGAYHTGSATEVHYGGTTSTGGYHYATGTTGAYSAGGYHTGGVYAAGVYRAP